MQQRSYGISGKDKEAGRHLWMPVCFIMISCVILFGIIRYDRSNQMPEDFRFIFLLEQKIICFMTVRAKFWSKTREQNTRRYTTKLDVSKAQRKQIWEKIRQMDIDSYRIVMTRIRVLCRVRLCQSNLRYHMGITVRRSNAIRLPIHLRQRIKRAGCFCRHVKISWNYCKTAKNGRNCHNMNDCINKRKIRSACK